MFRYDVTIKSLKSLGVNVMAALHVVATPIGNLDDLSARAVKILNRVDLITAEDTRRTGLLLKRLGIDCPMLSLHDHNEKQKIGEVIRRIKDGDHVALVSDAGTPLISDPGFHLVEQCHRELISVIPVVGPSSVTAALSVAGLATDRFAFEGFVPAKSQSRDQFYRRLANEARTLVFFEAPHRIEASIQSLETVVGSERRMAICRELTKTFEQIIQGPIGELRVALAEGAIPQKGEFVLVLARAAQEAASEIDNVLLALLPELSPSKAASVAARLTSEPKSKLYNRAIELKSWLE